MVAQVWTRVPSRMVPELRASESRSSIWLRKAANWTLLTSKRSMEKGAGTSTGFPG